MARRIPPLNQLKAFEATTVVESLGGLERAIRDRLACLSISFS